MIPVYSPPPWRCSQADANVTLESGAGIGLHGQTALHLSYASGTGLAGLGNRGFKNEGLYLQQGKSYDGYLFVRSEAAVTLTVAVMRYAPNSTETTVLAKQQLEFGGGNWTRLGFTLTPSSAALCDGIAPMSDPDIPCGDDGSTTVGHLCVRCTGQFVIGLSSPGDAFVDFAVLQPGVWGRAAGPGGPLPVLVEAVDTLKTMGVTTIRQGGSFVSYYGDYCTPLSVQQASAPRRPAHPPARQTPVSLRTTMKCVRVSEPCLTCNQIQCALCMLERVPCPVPRTPQISGSTGAECRGCDRRWGHTGSAM